MAKNENFAKIKLTLDGKEVEWSLDKIRKEAAKTAKQIADTDQSNKKLLKELQAKYNALRNAEEDLIPVMERVNHYMKELGQTSTRDIGRATRQLTELRDSLPGDSKDLAKLNGVIDKFKDWMKQNRDLGMTFEEASKMLKNMTNTPTGKLEQGLAAIRKELEATPKDTQWDAYLRKQERVIEAELKLRELGAAGTSPIKNMNDEQLRNEQSRLRSLYSATDGVNGYETVSQEAINRLQSVNKEIKDRAAAERDAAKAAQQAADEQQRQLDYAEEEQRTQRTLADLNKATYEDLEVSLKHLQEEQKKYRTDEKDRIQQNLRDQERLKQKMKEMQQLTLSDKEINDRVNNSKRYNVKELQQAYDQLKRKMMELNTSETDAIKQTRRQMQSLEKDIKAVSGEATGLTKIWKTAVRNISTYMGVFAAAGFLKQKIQSIVRDNFELSDSMAQVQKVTGLTGNEIKSLNTDLAKFDTRTTLTQLNDLAYSAGKMGLGKYGVEGIEGFVRATNQLQVALGDDLGSTVEESITPLAKLAENLGLIQKMGVEKSMMAIGSAINELSQTTTAAGKNIVDFARRLQPSAQLIKLTTDEILALGSASDSFGVTSEVSSTAFTKFLTSYRTNTAEIEKLLGITKGTLDQFFDQGRTIEGLMMIFQRMHEIGDLRYLEDAFKALGSEGSKMFLTFGAFAKNIDTFRDHLITANEAFAEATSVTNEFNLVQETAQGLIERSSNMWQNAFANPEGVDTIKAMATEWYNLTKELTNSTNWLTGVKASLEAIAWILTSLLKILPDLTRAMMFFGVARAIRYIWIEVQTMTVSMNAAGTAAARFSAIMKSNVWVLAATAIALIGSHLYDLAKASREAAKSTDVLKEADKAAEDESRSRRVELKKLYDATKDHTKSIEERKDALRQMVGDDKYKKYYSQLATEKDLANAAALAYRDLTSEIFKTAQARAYSNKITELENKRMELEDRRAAQQEWIKANKSEYQRKSANAATPSSQVARTFSPGLLNPVSINNDRFIQQYESTVSSVSDINEGISTIDKNMEKLKGKIQGLGITPETTTTPTVPTTTDDNKKGTKVPEWMVEEKKEAEKNTKAIIGSIEEFYRLQEAAANELAASGQLRGDEFNMLITHIKNRKDKMLLEARRAIVGDPNEFENERKTITGDLIKRDDAVSNAAITRIMEAEPARQGAALRKYDGSESVYGLDSNAYLNSIRKNAAQNELNIQRREAAIQTEIDKVLMQYMYVEQAQKTFGDNLVKLGLVTDGYDKVVRQLADGTKVVANTRDVQSLATKVTGLDSRFHSVDTNDPNELANMLNYIMTDQQTGQREQFASIFPDLDKWLEQPEQYKEKMQALYELMLQYEGTYYDKLKQTDDLQNKRLDSWWEHSEKKKENDQVKRNIQLYDFQYNTMHEGETMGFMMGLTNDVSQDPEVMREKAILEEKMALWQKAKEEREANIISEEVYQERLRAMQDQTMNYTKAVMQNIDNRISRIKNFVKPVETAANTIGKKLGDMIFNMESESMTWEQIWKNMALAVAENVLTMIGQYAQFQITKAALNKAEIEDEAQKAQIMTMLGISEGAAKTIGTLGWVGIALIPVITSLLLGLLSSALSTKDSNSSSSTSTANTKLVSGMLTYDKGNVQRFIGQDGKVYTATEEPQPKDGLVTHPIATTVQGQPALVAENGPEIVIGRQTTRAIQMNEPELIKYLATYEQHGGRGYRTYDTGNVQDVPVSGGYASSNNEGNNDNEAMHRTLTALNETVALLQQQLAKGIGVNMFGHNGLYENMNKANNFMKKYK